MKSSHPSYTVETLCRLFGKSRQAYYEKSYYAAAKSSEEETIIALAREARKDFPRMGAKKLLVYLKPKLEAMNLSIGRDAFIELLYRHYMLVKRLRNKRKTTFSNHWMRKYPNLIRNYTPLAPNLLWVSDITYIEMKRGFAYLSLITDVYSRKIVGWDLSRRLHSDRALKALEMALSGLSEYPTGLIHHSDRGSQYCSASYVNLLTRHKIKISMTESGDPLENAIAERVNGILKTEWLNKKQAGTWQETGKLIRKIIELYNNQRPHQSISYMVPSFVYENKVKTERKWKNYYRKEKTGNFDEQCKAMAGQKVKCQAILGQRPIL